MNNYTQNKGKEVAEKIKAEILFEEEYKNEVTGFDLTTYLKGNK